MPTFASGDDPYCTVTQFLRCVDERAVRELLSDREAPLNHGELAADPTLDTLLKQASGLVESYCTRGQYYVIDPNATPPRNDLADLTGNSKEFLALVVAKVGFWLLWCRRPNMADHEPGDVKMAREWLHDLAAGEAVFGIVENQQAGHLTHTVDSESDIFSRNLPTIVAGRLFGRRVDRIPRLY